MNKKSITDINLQLEAQLAEEQRQILHRTVKNSCVLATAGSGKTRSVVHSILYDFANGIHPNELIAFTFTEKAANELFVRTYDLSRKLLGLDTLQGLSIGTIHSWCFNYLISKREFSNYSPLDELHLDSIVSRLYDSLEIGQTYNCSFPRGIDIFLRDLEVFYNEMLDVRYLPENIKNSIIKFTEILKRERLLTYGGMIRNTIEALIKEGPISALKRLYVDEYQDVNPAQVLLIKKMLPDTAQLIVVGDDLQCIYNWRGSDVSRIVNFGSDFLPSEVIRLETNYRSLPSIVKTCNTIGSNITVRDTKKEMKPKRKSTLINETVYLSYSSEFEQAKAIVETIQKFHNEGFEYRDIAILLRSVRLSGPIISSCFQEASIPFISPTLSRGGSLIRDFILPIVQFLCNTHKEPKNELEEKELQEYGRQFELKLQKWILSTDQLKKTIRHLGRIAEGIIAASEEAYDVRGRIYDLLEIAGIGAESEDANIMLSLGIASQIIRSVEEAHRRRIKGEKRKTPEGVWTEVYYALLRRSVDFGESIPLVTFTDQVSILTVHQAKGLEWPIVIIPSLIKGLFPVKSRKHECSYDARIITRYGTSLEDERRLFYVAVTRAIDRLVLMDFGEDGKHVQSIFLKDLISDDILLPSKMDRLSKMFWKKAKDIKRNQSGKLVRIGLSDILIYLECPFQYGLRRLVNIEPSVGEELGFGKGMHELIQRRYEAATNWNDNEIEKRTEEHIFLPLMAEEAEIKERKSAFNRLKELQNLNLFSGEIITEHPIEMPLNLGVISGTIDVVKKIKGKTVDLVDWKSNIHNEFISRYSKQMQMYASALRLQGYDVRKAELIDIGASFIKKKVISMNIDISEASIKLLVNELSDALSEISQSNYSPRPTEKSCSACDMKRLCLERITTI